MKLLKNTLFIIIGMFTIHSASARPMQTKGIKTNAVPVAARPVRAQAPVRVVPSTPTAAPVVIKGSFQDFMHQVRTMNSNDVIDNQGIFTDIFKNFVQSTNLTPFGMEILMQAGRNLHLPLLGNSKQDIALIQQVDNNIARLASVTKTSPVIPQPITRPTQTIATPPTPTGISKTKPIPGKPLTPQTPATTGPAQINKPAPKEKFIGSEPPMIHSINKPEDPYDYADLIKDQFDDDLKMYFIKQDNNTVVFEKNTNKFPSFARKITALMLKEYPQISLRDLIGTVEMIVLLSDSAIGLINRKQLQNYIKEIVTNEYNRLQQQTSPQPQPQQPQVLSLPQKSISSPQLKDLVIQKLMEIDQQKSIDYLFTENAGGNFWYIKIPEFKDSQQIQLAYGDALLLINKLVKILRDKYPDYISLKNRSASLDVVVTIIEDSIKDFLQQKYNKKFQDDDGAIVSYLSDDTFRKIMAQKP